MNFEITEHYRKRLRIFIEVRISFQKTLITKNSSKCNSRKKIVLVPSIFFPGNFENQKNNYSKSFAEIETKTEIEPRFKNVSEITSLPLSDIENKNINLRKCGINNFGRKSSIMRKETTKNLPPNFSRNEGFGTLRNHDFEAIDESVFYRTFVSVDYGSALIYLAAVFSLSLNKIHSFHVVATFRAVSGQV